jgi:hypothetical protein
MSKRSAIGLYAFLLAAALALTAVPADAQYAKRTLSDPATGESYHIEGAIGYWHPTADMSVSSESLGIPGSTIDFKKDLGLTDQGFPEFHVVLRPAKKQKFFFQYIPITYDQEHVLTREITFNGQAYNVGIPVNSTLAWKAYRFGYEYDFLYNDRWFAGFMLEAKYTDVGATLAEPGTTEFAHAQAPIPAIGGIVRVYVVPNISITGQVSGVEIPASASPKYNAHYADIDIYGTLNIINNAGVQLGYRSFNVGYLVNKDSGTFLLRGLYFGAVARF